MSTSTTKPTEVKEEVVEKKEFSSVQEELMSLSDEELVSRFVDIADRGFVSIRFDVPLPPEWHGEWVPDDPGSIAEAQQNGWIIDDKFAVKSGLHSDGTGKPKVGDVVHMIIPKRLKEIHDRAAQVRFDRTHRVSRNLPEETEFETQILTAGLQNKFKGNNINQSIQETVSGQSILSAIKGT